MSFWCWIGRHSWECLNDNNSQEIMSRLGVASINLLNRVCINCEKHDLRADQYLIQEKRQMKRTEIVKRRNKTGYCDCPPGIGVTMVSMMRLSLTCTQCGCPEYQKLT